MELKTVDDILDYAIAQEEKAAAFYRRLAERATGDHIRKAFLDFAREEDGHKLKLLKVKEGKQLLPSEDRILDLKIGDYLDEAAPIENPDYQQALIIAMQAEKRAFKLYTDLASAMSDPTLKAIFQALAQEEAKHKLRFEVEYDEVVLREN